MRTVTNYHYYEELNLTIGEDGGNFPSSTGAGRYSPGPTSRLR